MGFEMPVDVDYFDHRKTVLLIGLIGTEADIYPLRLWKYCVKSRKDGVLSGPQEVEAAVRWTGESGKLAAALQTAGFFDKDSWAVHDWKEGIGFAVEKYEAKKRKQREDYALEHGIHRPAGHAGDENGKPVQPDRSSKPEALAADEYLRHNPNCTMSRHKIVWEFGAAKKKAGVMGDTGFMEKLLAACMDEKQAKDVGVWDLLKSLLPKSPAEAKADDLLAKQERHQKEIEKYATRKAVK